MAGYHFVIADDHPLFRDALRQTLQDTFQMPDITEAGSLNDVTAKIEDTGDVDLLLLDLMMPGVQGFSGLVFIRAQFPGIPVAVVSAREEAAVIRRAIDLGASGFIPKSTPIQDMQTALRSVLDGNVWIPDGIDINASSESEADHLAQRIATLTPQQVRVLMMLREGLLNKQIAYELSVSEATVKAHVSAILQKLNVESRTQAVIAAAKIDEDHHV